MVARIISVWFSVFVSCATALLVYVGKDGVAEYYRQSLGGRPLPSLTSLMMYDGWFLYLVPVVFILWALVYSFWSRRDIDHALVLCMTVIGSTIFFLAVCFCAFSIPLICLNATHA